MNHHINQCFYVLSGNKIVAFAEEDDEELVDVEEGDTAVKDEGIPEADEDTGPKPSPDAETTILFVNPVPVPGSPLGMSIPLMVYTYVELVFLIIFLVRSIL